VRAAALMNRFGAHFHHIIVSLDGRMGCAERLEPSVSFKALPFLSKPREALPSRLSRIRSLLREVQPDKLVTSNWGSIEWAMANRWPRLPHLHMEDGFGPDEATGQKPHRVCTRCLVLRGSRVLLPSRTLLAAAHGLWRLPEDTLRYVPNGIDLSRFSPDGPRVPLDVPGEGLLLGTVVALRAEKNLGRLLRAMALACAQGAMLRLAIVGEGPELGGLEAQAALLGLTRNVRFVGYLPDPAAAYRGFDAFALSSDTEQMPFSILEAMGTGLPIAATDVGDVRAMLAPANHPFVAGREDEALAAALVGLARTTPGERAEIGRANRVRAEVEYDQETMAAHHVALWRER